MFLHQKFASEIQLELDTIFQGNTFVTNNFKHSSYTVPSEYNPSMLGFYILNYSLLGCILALIYLGVMKIV